MTDHTLPQSVAVEALPEFADHQTARKLFGLSRSYLYQLEKERRIRSVSLRKRGASRGRRLWDCASIRAYFKTQVEG